MQRKQQQTIFFLQPNDSILITCMSASAARGLEGGAATDALSTKREDDPHTVPKKKKRAISEEYRAKLLQSLATANERKQSLNAVRRSIKVTDASRTVDFD